MKIGGISFTPVRRAGGRPGRSSRPSATSAPGDHSNEATSRRHPRLADPLTTRAYEAAQPAQAPDMLSARRLAAEPLVNLLKRPGAINPRDRIPCDFHPVTLSRGLTGVKGIPYLLQTCPTRRILSGWRPRPKTVRMRRTSHEARLPCKFAAACRGSDQPRRSIRQDSFAGKRRVPPSRWGRCALSIRTWSKRRIAKIWRISRSIPSSSPVVVLALALASNAADFSTELLGTGLERQTSTHELAGRSDKLALQSARADQAAMNQGMLARGLFGVTMTRSGCPTTLDPEWKFPSARIAAAVEPKRSKPVDISGRRAA